MQVISTINWEDHLIEGKPYDVIYMWKNRKRGFNGNSIYGYQVVMDNGEAMWMFPEEGYVPLKIKRNPRWRAILKSMGYRRVVALWGTVSWISSANNVVLIEKLIDKNNLIEYVKDMEEYQQMFDDYYMEMENLWTEGELI